MTKDKLMRQKCCDMVLNGGYPDPAEVVEVLNELEAERDALAEALRWYGEQARLARLIHSEGDVGRHNLQDDGGRRACAALAKLEKNDG